MLMVLMVLTLRASAAINSIRVAKSCFHLGETITTSFTVASPRNGDWVGLTKSSSNLLGGVFYPLFVYTCGTSTCVGAPEKGTLSIFNNLVTGSYKAVLLPNNTFTPLVVSALFTVSAECQSPAKPLARPTTRPNPAPAPSATTVNLVAAKQALKQASVQIEALVQNNRLLLQQFLRLLFHDCHVVCDGKAMEPVTEWP